MKNKIFFGFIIIFTLLFLFSFNSVALAAGTDYGLKNTVNRTSLKTAFSVDRVNADGASGFLSSRLGILVGAILSFIGVIFMVLIIYGGILWMTAMGNEQKVEKAKNLIIQSIIGLIIILSAYTITSFIGRQLTDTNPAPSPQMTTDNTAGGSD